jgi:DNA-binding PadR family transcriptional regulator
MVKFIIKAEGEFVKEENGPNIQERILRAFLDLVILQMLMSKSMTAYEIDNSMLEKFGGKRSTNVVYTKLAIIERNGWVSCVHSKHGRCYNITEKGKKIVNNMPIMVAGIHKIVPIIFETK